jgi:hypothetical protein
MIHQRLYHRAGSHGVFKQPTKFHFPRRISLCLPDADDSVCNDNDMTPLEVAAVRGHTEVVRVLQHPGVESGQ